MNKWFVLTAVFSVLVIAAGSIFMTGLVRVQPSELAFVIKNGRVGEQIRPGLRWSWPFFRSIGYIEAFNQRKQSIEMVGVLSDGAKCSVKAIISYRIANPRRAMMWRLANGKDVSQASIASGRNDYVELGHLYERILHPAMKQITSQKAARSAVELWIWKNMVKKMRTVKNSDGTLIMGQRVMEIGCSMNKYLGVRFKRPKVKFGKPQKFKKYQRKNVSGDIHSGLSFSVEVVLQGRSSVMINNLATEYVVIDSERFKIFFGGSDKRHRNLDLQLTPDVKSMIREVMKNGKVTNVPNIDLTWLFRPGSILARRFEYWGVRLTNIATDKTSYSLQIEKR